MNTPTVTPDMIVCPATGKAIDLAGLSPREKLLCIFLGAVDPKTYEGDSPQHCLLGQAAENLRSDADRALFGSNPFPILRQAVGAPSDVDLWNDMWTIFTEAADEEFFNDYLASVGMASDVLQTSLSSLESRVTPMAAPVSPEESS